MKIDVWKFRGIITTLIVVLMIQILSCNRKGDSGSVGADKGKHPNIILLTVDTLRADHMALYGYHRNTMPAIEAFAETGVVFDNAVVSRGNTRASYASMLTGLYPFHHGVYNNYWVLHEDLVTLPEVLKSAGYHTAAFMSNFVLVGALSGCNQGFDIYDDRVEQRELNRSNYERTAANSLKAILEWLETDPPQPFFLFTNFIDPHGPYFPPNRFRNFYKSKKTRMLAPEQIPSYQFVEDALNYYDYVDRYDAEIRYLDEALGQLIEELKRKSLWDETVVVFTADHGESLGEHKIFFEHQYHVFEETTRVPLVIRLPGTLEGKEASIPRRVSSLCSPMDLMPTILDYVNIPFHGKVDGQSLLSILRGTEGGPRSMFIEFPNHSHPKPMLDYYGLRTATHKLIRSYDPKTHKLIAQAVFDITADPLEQRPIGYNRELQLHVELSEQMDGMLAQVLDYEIPFTPTFYHIPHSKREKYVEQRKGRPDSIAKELSPEQIQRLRSLGYVQ